MTAPLHRSPAPTSASTSTGVRERPGTPGWPGVTTPLVAFVDADVDAPEGWLDRLLPHFEDDRVALVAPRVASAPARTMLAGYEAGNSPLDLGEFPGPCSCRDAGQLRAGGSDRLSNRSHP